MPNDEPSRGVPTAGPSSEGTLERGRLEGLETHNAALLAEVANRLRAQEASEARLRFATEAGRLGVWELDLPTREPTTSAVFRAVSGRSPTDPFPYEALEGAIHPDHLPRMREAIERLLDTGADYDIEYRVTRLDGAEAWVNVRAQIVRGSDGTPQRLAGIALDSAERHKAELPDMKRTRDTWRRRLACDSTAPAKSVQNAYSYDGP